ncbi:MAG: T9SS type A sorting domain-containing protein [Bacteroidales bacterium]|nr:T9SS type A sorting domain-containing protein [Bacteroidales bacterium]
MRSTLPLRYLLAGIILWGLLWQDVAAQNTLESPYNLHVEITDTAEQNVTITWDFGDYGNPDFDGFYLFRNNNIINATPLEEGSFIDYQLDTGTYTYKAVAIYASDTSDKSNRGIVTIRDGYYFGMGDGNSYDDTWSIYLNSGMLGQQVLSPGDEIAIFDDTTVVGREKLSIEPYPENDLIELVAFSEFAEYDGYTPGNEYLFKLYDASNDTVYDEYLVTFDDSPGNYVGEVFPEGQDPQSLVDLTFSLGLPQPENLQITNEEHDIILTWELEQQNRDLIGYDVFRDGEKLNDDPIPNTTYTDSSMLSGTYEYYVVSVHDEGSSLPSETEEFTLGTVYYNPYFPDNQFNPMTLHIHEATVMGTPLNAFDEIGVFRYTATDTTCFGAKSLTATSGTYTADTILVGADDPDTDPVEGFSAGDTLFYRLYDYQSGLEYRDVLVTLEEDPSSLTFTPNTTNNVSLGWIPYGPVNLTANNTGYDITLSWEENPLNPDLTLEGYNIYRNGTTIETLVDGTTYTDINLLVDVYDYHVEAQYEESISRSSDTITAEVPTQYFTPLSENETDGTMTFYVTQAQVDGQDLETYDEIGIFSFSEDSGQEICVGAGSLHQSLSLENPIEITAYQDNPETPEKDGYEEGDSIRYKFWHPTDSVINTIESSAEEGYDYYENFQTNTTNYVNLSFTTPPPVKFYYQTNEYCRETTGHIYVTTQDFQEVNELHLGLDFDTTHYSYQSVTAEQDFLETADFNYNEGVLTIDWTSEDAYSVADEATLFDITVVTDEHGETNISWTDDSYATGMEYQGEAFYPESFYIEKKPETPAAIVGDDEVCNDITYSNYSISPISNATGYSWDIDPGEAAESLDPDGTSCQVYWNPDFADTATLKVAGENYCGTGDSAYKTIAIVNTVVVSISIEPANSFECEGDTVQIIANATNTGNNPDYDWFVNGNETYENSDTFTSTGLSDGDEVYCVVESSQPCAENNPATSNTIALELDPLPETPSQILGDTLMCNTIGSSEYTTPGSEFSDSYDWNLTPDEAGETNCLNTTPCQTVTIEWNTDWTGIAKLWVRGVNDCGPGDYMTPPLNIHRDYCTSTSQAINNQWQFYPNPVEYRLTIESNTGEKMQWQLLRASGQVLESGRLTGKEASIDVEALSRGIYFLKVRTNRGSVVKKVIKK